MGILFTRKVEGPATLGVWEIKETVDQLLGQVNLSVPEKQLFNSFRTEWRRKQWLAYRRLIREIISPKEYPVHYDDYGKPFLAGSNWHISVTHTEDYAAVIISKDHTVGIDMERIRPRIQRVKEKFLSAEELSAIPPAYETESLTLAWCAKEAIYKLFGYRYLDFKKHIKVTLPAHDSHELFNGEVVQPQGKITLRINYERRGELLIVWLVDDEGQ